MTSRDFTDERGQIWHVWAVQPDTLERRLADDPLLTPPAERRVRRESRVQVSNPVMTKGWLAFESSIEKRRLAPIPDGWSEMDDGGLRELLARATKTRKARRLLD